MLFIPEKKVKKIIKQLNEEHRAKAREQTLRSREEYLKAKENGTLDEYFQNLNN